MIAARVLYAGLGAVLLITVLTAVAVVLGVSGETPPPGAELAICEAGDRPESCYSVRA